MRFSARNLMIGAFVALAASLAQAQVLYGITGAGGASSSLYTVDPVTGATTLVGPTGFSHVTAIDFDPTSGILYGVVSDDNGTGPLITINPATGAGTVIGVVGQQIPDITIGADGVLRGWSENGDNVVTINKTTAAVTTTTSNLGTSQTGVAIAGPGTIYVKVSDELYTVDTTTGVETFLWAYGIDTHNLLENEPGGTLLTGDRDGSGTQFYRLDPATGSQTALGHSPQAFSAIAFGTAAVAAPPAMVPTLSPLALALLSLGLGLAGLGYWRRKGVRY